MKKVGALLLGAFLTVSYVFADDATEADKKWLQTVETLVAKGETKISVKEESRVKLLKEWAAKKDYSVSVSKTEAGFRVDLSKNVAKK